MKKYVMLIAFTLVCVAGITITGNFARNSAASVNSVMVKPITVEDVVVCSGKVERVSSKNVFVPVASLAKKVYVKEGDQVQEGQLLMDVVSTPQSTGQADLQVYADLLKSYGLSSILENSGALGSGADTGVESQLTAPISGTVLSVSMGTDGSLSSTQPVMVIAGDVGLQVRLSVSESQISAIRLGQKATVTGSGFKGSTYEGVVKSIAGEAKQAVSTTGSESVVEVIVSVDYPGKDIKPGYSAKARIVTAQNENVLVVPYEAVKADNNGNEFVYKVEGKKAVKVPVVTAGEYENGFSIKSGLSADDTIVRNPTNLYNGARINPQPESTEETDG